MKKKLISGFASIFMVIQLVACDYGMSGQIEKCVEAGLASNGPYKNSTEKAADEVAYRMHCMKSAAGKE
jgi:hypothetical protein